MFVAIASEAKQSSLVILNKVKDLKILRCAQNDNKNWIALEFASQIRAMTE